MNNFEQEALIVSKKRVVDHGEVYTPKHLVNDMLDLVKHETERIESRFLEPACGTGNFLLEILHRKMNVVIQNYKQNQFNYEYYSVIATSSIYGIDILEDNIISCRKRLLTMLNKIYLKLYKNKCKEKYQKTIQYILETNIICGDALSFKTTKNNSQPIIFAEWSPIAPNKIKRRDFSFEQIIKQRISHEGATLFSDMGEEAFIPHPVKNYPLVHFLEIIDSLE